MSTVGIPPYKIKKKRVHFSPGDKLTYTIRSFDVDISGWTFTMKVVDTDKQDNSETLLELSEGDGLSVDDTNDEVSLDIPGDDTEVFEIGDSAVGILKATGTGDDPKRTLRLRFRAHDYFNE